MLRRQLKPAVNPRFERFQKETKIEDFLRILHEYYTSLPIVIRDSICKDCNWSIPTYYRKVKDGIDKRVKYDRSNLSNAERAKIVDICRERFLQAIDYINQL